MAPVKQRPGARSHPSSTQEDSSYHEHFDVDPTDNPWHHGSRSFDEDETETHGDTFVDVLDDCRPQLDNPSQMIPDDDDDYALKEHMNSQHQDEEEEDLGLDFDNQAPTEEQNSNANIHPTRKALLTLLMCLPVVSLLLMTRKSTTTLLRKSMTTTFMTPEVVRVLD